MRPRLAIVTSHPIQYQAPLFRLLADRGVVDPEVLFLSDHGVAATFDPGFGREVRYDVPLTEGYRHRFLANRSPRPSVDTPTGMVNPEIGSALRSDRVDAVLVHGYANAGLWAAYLTARARGIPYLLRGETQGPSPEDRRGRRWAAKAAILGPLVRGAAGCTVIGRRNSGFYLALGARPEQLFWAPYTVDNEFFAARGALGRTNRDERLRASGLDPAKPVVLFAAKLLPRKRPLDLLAATEGLDDRVSVVVIGDGELRAEVEAAAAGRPATRVLGFVNQQELGEWYGVADVFVLPSDRETWGLAVNEAMACGAVPVVSSSVGCGDDLVADGAGRVFPTGDRSALRDALVELVDADTRAAARAEVGRRIGRYGLEATAAGIEAATLAALGEKSP